MDFLVALAFILAAAAIIVWITKPVKPGSG
jgi:hypothetical protein